jgi:hypothetical protein
MGRWAQRERRGGGRPPFGGPFGAATQILQIKVRTSDAADVTFNGTVSVGDFDATHLDDLTAGGNANNVFQLGPNRLTYTAWDNPIAVGHLWSYDDVVSGIITPQNGVMV